MNQVYNRWLKDEGISLADKEILSSFSAEEIEENFGSPLEFGTGGLRSIVGLGANKMNLYTVAQITEGVSQVLKNMDYKKIVICFDGRENSLQFAREVAEVLLGNGFSCYLFKELRPTPMLSFSVGHLSCDAGIMITASHNPKEYNGYKIYDRNGAQMNGAIEQEIVRAVQQVTDFSKIPHMEIEKGLETKKFEILDASLDEPYMDAVLSTLQREELLTLPEKENDLVVVYTPLHGTGAKIMPKLFEKVPYIFYTVPEQMGIDPNFSTVPYPNPEEVEAFEYSLTVAKQKNADIIIATDPDADRLGAMVKHEGAYVRLTGNELGLLLLYFILTSQEEKGILPSNGLIISSAVSSPLAKIMAEDFGIFYEPVLIGFKHAGEKIDTYKKSKEKTFLFAYEESCGYLAGNYTKDKDGIQAGLLLCEMANFYKKQNKTLIHVLDEMYERFGYSYDALHMFVLPGKKGRASMNKVMEYVFSYPIKKITHEEVIQIDDYKHGISIKEGKEEALPTSNFIKFFTAHSSVGFRPSSTEPKLKIYVNCWGENEEEVKNNRKEVLEAMVKLVEEIIKD